MDAKVFQRDCGRVCRKDENIRFIFENDRAVRMESVDERSFVTYMSDFGADEHRAEITFIHRVSEVYLKDIMKKIIKLSTLANYVELQWMTLRNGGQNAALILLVNFEIPDLIRYSIVENLNVVTNV